MEGRRYPIVWTKRSQQQLRAAYKYISRNSIQNATNVIDNIVAAVEKSNTNPGYYSPDKYKTDNDGSYHAFEKHSYRVVYRFNKNIIRMLRARHTKMEAKMY